MGITPLLLPRKRNANFCKEKFVAQLSVQVREARDSLLALASSSDISADNMAASGSSHAVSDGLSTQPLAATGSSHAASSDCSGSQRIKRKPRKSSMSYWTAESLDALDAPPP